jgi:hypothetical protein
VGLLLAAALVFYFAQQGHTWAGIFSGILFVFALLIPISHSQRATDFLTRWRELLEEFYPIFGFIFTILDKQKAYRALVEEMANTIDYYNIGTLDQTCLDKLMDTLPVQTLSVPEQAEAVAKDILGCVSLEKFDVDFDVDLLSAVLVVLNADGHGRSGEAHIQHIRSKGEQYFSSYITLLASVINNSGQLPEREIETEANGHVTTEYSLTVLEQLLTPRHTFSRATLSKSLVLANTYVDFLTRNSVPPSGATLAIAENFEAEIHSHLNDHQPLSDWDIGALNLLINTGQAAIKATFPEREPASLSPSLLRSYCLISLAVFLSNKSLMQRVVCKMAGEEEEAARIALAYLEFDGNPETKIRLGGGQQCVNISYLMQEWEGKIEKRQHALGQGFAIELATMQKSLDDGIWYTGLWLLLWDVQNFITSERERLLALARQKRSIIASLRRIFKQLRVTTIERHLQSEKTHAYLMTFYAKGKLARLLNCLVSTDPVIQQTLEGLGIRRQIENRAVAADNEHAQSQAVDKYVFKNYTPNSRIGVIPAGWSFEEFYQAFQTDFAEVIAGRETLFPNGPYSLKDIEVILHRFGLEDHYIFKHPLRSQEAIQDTKDLIGDGIKDAAGLLSAIGYEIQDDVTIADAISEGTIGELVSQEVDADERELLVRQDLLLKLTMLFNLGQMTLDTQPILAYLEQAACHTTHAFVRGGYRKDNAQERLTRFVMRLLDSSNDSWQRSQQIAQLYLENLEEALSAAAAESITADSLLPVIVNQTKLSTAVRSKFKNRFPGWHSQTQAQLTALGVNGRPLDHQLVANNDGWDNIQQFLTRIISSGMGARGKKSQQDCQIMARSYAQALRTTMNWSGSITVMRLPFSDQIFNGIQLSGSEREQLDNADQSLKFVVLHELEYLQEYLQSPRNRQFRATANHHIRRLGHELAIEADLEDAENELFESTKSVLTNTLADSIPLFTQGRCGRIAENYVSALRAVGGIR